MKKLSAEQRRKQIQIVTTIPDDQIDTSDIPELTDEQMIEGVRGQFCRPMKHEGKRKVLPGLRFADTPQDDVTMDTLFPKRALHFTRLSSMPVITTLAHPMT